VVYNKALMRLRRLLAPCILCGSRETMPGVSVCEACLNDLALVGTACARCGHGLPSDGVCGRCLRMPPPFNRTVAPFQYRFPMDRLVRAGKFQARLDVLSMLGRLMVPALDGCDPPDAIIPVPLHRRRLRARGFNQSLELARPLSLALDAPIDDRWCLRVRETDQQSALPAGRRHGNVRGCFALDGGRRWRHVAIVDDVMTTGATAAALAEPLTRAGVERIDVWTCCRAEAPK